VHDYSLVAEPGAGGADREEHRGQDNRCGALHVVIEGAAGLGVFVQDSAGAGGAEVLRAP
jgi:hypothetical protein